MKSSTFVPCSECGAVNRVGLDEAATKKPVCGKCKAELSIKGAVVELTGGGLTHLIQKISAPILVDFWAPWCGPCRSFAPTYSRVAPDYAGRVVFTKLDTEAFPMAGDTFGIRSIPTLVLFQGGIEKNRISGALPEPSLRQLIDQWTAG